MKNKLFNSIFRNGFEAPVDTASSGAANVALADPVSTGPDYIDSKEQLQLHGIHRTLTQQSLVDLRPTRLYRIWKRILDISVSLLALSLFGLMLPIIALIIKIDSRGPIFYRQDRVGVNRRRSRGVSPESDSVDRRRVLQPGRPFQIIKLRSMTTNAEEKGPQWAKKNDCRITRVGYFLRKTRLDEVPQFVNVLKGEMSLIGPRPERLFFVRQFEKDVPYYDDRLLVKPGITGLAQVCNGYDTDADSVGRKVAYDRRYIAENGIFNDIGILLRTVRVVLRGEGAH